MSKPLRRIIALTCGIFLTLNIFFILIALALTLRGEDAAMYASAQPSLVTTGLLLIICWLLRDEFRRTPAVPATVRTN